jgi:hypothetical protein
MKVTATAQLWSNELQATEDIYRQLPEVSSGIAFDVKTPLVSQLQP